MMNERHSTFSYIWTHKYHVFYLLFFNTNYIIAHLINHSVQAVRRKRDITILRYDNCRFKKHNDVSLKITIRLSRTCAPRKPKNGSWNMFLLRTGNCYLCTTVFTAAVYVRVTRPTCQRRATRLAQ